MPTCGCTNAKAAQHAKEDGKGPYEQQDRADDVLWGDALWQSLSKVNNHAHGLDQRVEEELAVWVELRGVAPVHWNRLSVESRLMAW